MCVYTKYSLPDIVIYKLKHSYQCTEFVDINDIYFFILRKVIFLWIRKHHILHQNE